MKKHYSLFIGISLFCTIIQAQTVTDIDNNTYNTVTIGTQIWTKENLKVKHFNDGTSLSYITDNAAWSSHGSPAYCYYNNDSLNGSVYGLLYDNYVTLSSKNVCPVGWHIPSEPEWEAMTITLLGGQGIAGGEMKETGTAHWTSPNLGATNSTGFTGLPGGFRRGNDGTFGNMNTDGYWHTTYVISCGPMIWNLSNDNTEAYLYGGVNGDACSIRCVKNVSNDINETGKANQLEIYPNPAKDVVMLDFNYEAGTKAKVTIIDAMGRIMYSSEISTEQTKIKLSSLNSGIYELQLHVDGKSIISKKLVITK